MARPVVPTNVLDLSKIALRSEVSQTIARHSEDVSFLVDDIGAFYAESKPVEMLARYYQTLAWDGEAWVLFPKTFWVFLEDQHRVNLTEYLALKFPTIATKVRQKEIEARIEAPRPAAAGEWIRLKKDRKILKLELTLKVRSTAAVPRVEGTLNAPFIEFVELIEGSAPKRSR